MHRDAAVALVVALPALRDPRQERLGGRPAGIGQPDLAAHVLYERRNVPLLLELLPRLLDSRGELWLADPGRAPADVLLEGLAEGWKRRSEADGRVTVHRLLRAAVPSASE